MFWDFHTTGISFGGGGNDKLLVCSTQRNSTEGQRPSHTSSKLTVLQGNEPLASVALSEDDQNGPRSDASA